MLPAWVIDVGRELVVAHLNGVVSKAPVRPTDQDGDTAFPT